MKAFFVITRTNEMHKHIDSFTCLGNEASYYMFEHRSSGGGQSVQALDAEIRKSVEDAKPEIIVYVGACSGRMPSTELFRELKKTTPTICLVSDAADQPWWPKVEEYDREKAFSVIVSMDGNKEWPQHETHITALTPVDPSVFCTPPKPHAERNTTFGFAGNPGGGHRVNGKIVGRRPYIDAMTGWGLKIRTRAGPTGSLDIDRKGYSEAAQFMSDVRIMPNFAFTGSFQRWHVKGRVVESGWAGSLLLEMKDSPAKDWFTPGEDFLHYDSLEDVKKIVEHFKDKPLESQAFGERLRKKVEENHSPDKFWGKVIGRLRA